MAANLQINSSPPIVGLIGEGLKYEIERTSILASSAASLIITLPQVQASYTDKYFEISTKGGLLKFFFKVLPDESGLEVRYWPSGVTFEVFTQRLQEDLQQNYLLLANYKIETHTLGIKIIARENGTAYNLALTDTDVTNLVEYINNSGVDDSTPSDYKIQVGLIAITSNISEVLNLPDGEDMLTLDSNNKVIADVSEYLKSFIKSAITYPYNGVLVIDVEDAVIQYYIRYAEYCDGAVQKVYNTYSNKRYAIAGRLKQIDSDYISSKDSDYWTDYSSRFLTWAPLSKVTYPEKPERLYFLMRESGNKLMVNKHYALLSETFEIHTFSNDPYTVVEILCGLPELFVGADISNLVSYDVYIVDDKDGAISEIRNFVVDHSSYHNIRTLIFKNSFGLFDLLHCTGDLTIKDNVKRTQMEVLTNNAFRKRIQLAENNDSYILSSGWLDGVEYKRWLEDLQLSTQGSFVVGDYLLPFMIKTGKVEREKDREHNHSIKITFEPDYNNEAYSSIVEDIASVSYIDRLVNSIYTLYSTLVTDDEGIINSETITKTVYKQLLTS